MSSFVVCAQQKDLQFQIWNLAWCIRSHTHWFFAWHQCAVPPTSSASSGQVAMSHVVKSNQLWSCVRVCTPRCLECL
eukprot:4996805-Amphidinium_carterae.2